MSTPNEPDKTPNAGASGPTRGAVVQPWHRGQGESGGSRTQTAPVNGRTSTGNPVAAKPANGNSRDDLQESRDIPTTRLEQPVPVSKPGTVPSGPMQAAPKAVAPANASGPARPAGPRPPQQAVNPQARQVPPGAGPQRPVQQAGTGPQPVIRPQGPPTGPQPVIRQQGPATGPQPAIRQQAPGTGPQPVIRPQGPPTGPHPVVGKQGAGAQRPAAAPATPPKRFAESPTTHIERRDLPGEELPNLDKIHHVDEAVGTAAGPRTGPVQVGGSGGVRAAVQVRRIDPWATFKVAAVLAVVGFFIWMIAVAVLYLVLGGMGVWDQLNSSFNTLTTDGTSIDSDVIGAGSVFFWSALIGAISAVLITALTTVGAYIYNICADLVGGVEITIADLD